jgi:hypothetical protein
MGRLIPLAGVLMGTPQQSASGDEPSVIEIGSTNDQRRAEAAA